MTNQNQQRKPNSDQPVNITPNKSKEHWPFARVHFPQGTKRNRHETEQQSKHVTKSQVKRLRLLDPKCNTRIPELLEDLSKGGVEAVCLALGELFNILDEERTNQNDGGGNTFVLFRLCGHVTVLNAMKKHPKNEEIQLKGLCIFVKMVYNHEYLPESLGGIDGVSSGLAFIGVMEAALAALEDFPNNENICDTAISAINNLAFTRKTRAAALFFGLGGTPVVVSMEFAV